MANIRRNTPERFLLGFTVAALVVAVLAFLMRGDRDRIEWVDYPTALGDRAYYSALGDNDLHEANLRIAGQELPSGHFRQSLEPVPYDDATMVRVGREAEGRHTVYQPAEGNTRNLYFLKAGENLYHAFGERKHWPEFNPE